MPVLSAHFFALYYASLSVITPPVALASYTAASVAGGDPWKTGWYGFRLALAAYIVPFFFVYNDSLLGQGDASRIILALASGLIGTMSLAAVIEGYALTPLRAWQRVLCGVGAIMMIFPGWAPTLAGSRLLGSALVLACSMVDRVKQEREVLLRNRSR